LFGAGPRRMRPDVSYCEPWQGQKNPLSPLMRDRNAPKMRADADEHLPFFMAGLTRFSSVSGSGSVATFTSRASSISFLVRWVT